MKDSKILNKKRKKEKSIISETKEFDDKKNKKNISDKTDVRKIKFLQNLSNDATYISSNISKIFVVFNSVFNIPTLIYGNNKFSNII